MDTPDSITLKRCTKCGEEKPRDQFHRNPNNKDGLATWCKVCACEHTRNWRKANLERARENARIARRENKEKERESDRLYYARNKEKRLQYIAQWREDNPDYARDYARRYRNDHADRVRITKAKIYQRDGKEIREYQRNYRNNNTDKIQRYRKSNADKARIHGQRRRARKRNLPDTFTVADWKIALEHFGHACAVCGQGLLVLSHQDHWFPISSPDCPGTVPHNMVPLCSTCNTSKQDKMPADWLIDKFGPRKGRAILRKIEAFLESRRDA